MKSVYIILLVLLFSGCKKDDFPGYLDYRDPYTGKFMFTSIKWLIVMCQEPSSTCINGWRTSIPDTTYRLSNITRYDSSRIEFQFADGDLGSYNGSPIYLVIQPVINEDGELFALSSFVEQGFRVRDFQGKFHGKDTLKIYFEFSTGGMGSYYIYEILGIRDN